MGKVFKVQIVQYLDAEDRRVTKGTPGARAVKKESRKWYGQYKDADGVRRREPLSTDKTVAKAMLSDLERQVERGKAGLTDPHAAHKQAPIAEHVAAYESHLRHRGVADKHLSETLRRLRAVLEGAEIRRLADLKVDPVERFLGSFDEKVSARTRNTYRTSAKAFSRWCLKSRRLGEDPLVSLEAAEGPTVRQRRSLTDDELAKLLKVARERPWMEAMTVRTGKRKGLRVANVRAEVRTKLERLGLERALMYKLMVQTGLRRGELAALEVRHLDLGGGHPRLTLPASSTKNREAASLPIQADTATDLKAWLDATGRKGADPVFTVPMELVKILKRDLKAAGIPYRDDRGRTVDVHAFRHTTATMLARKKVSPRVAQEFMRHSDIKLTMQTYTDIRLLDEREALDAMPSLPLSGEPDTPESPGQACGAAG